MTPGDGSPPIRGVLFDFGSTLFAHAPLATTIREQAHRLGADVTEQRAAALARRIDAAAMDPAEMMHPRDLDSAVWGERWQVLYHLADEMLAGLGTELYVSMHDPLAWTPYHDAAAVLAQLHARGIPVGIVSNTGWDVRAAFAAWQMATDVSAFTLSYEVGAAKPDPRIFATACASIGVEPTATLMVGDDARSDGGAVAAGIRTLLLPPQPPGSDNGLATVLDLARRGGAP
jgi:HAD superfamily hydrolase (TIGR01509 family)